MWDGSNFMDFISIVSVQRLTDHLLNRVYSKKNIAKLGSESCDTEIFKTSGSIGIKYQNKDSDGSRIYDFIYCVYYNFIEKLYMNE